MTSHYSAELTSKGAIPVGSADPRIEVAIASALAGIKERLWFKPHAIRTFHSERYVRQQIAGEKPMALTFFLTLLAAVEKLGDREEQGAGREWVRRILDALAKPFGLEVVPRRDEEPKEELTSALTRTRVELDNLSEVIRRNGGRP